MKRLHLALIAGTVAALISAQSAGAASAKTSIGINVLLKQTMTSTMLTDLAKYGTVLDTYPKLRALTMKIDAGMLSTIRSRTYVAAANEDAERVGAPVPNSPVDDTSSGRGTWDLDQINVVDKAGENPVRQISQTGAGVYVAVIDTGLLSSWPYYFGTERIASQYGMAFGGGGGEKGSVSNQPNKWQTDQDSHGTHVASTIIGYNRGSYIVQGVAPQAKIIPVKVLNNNGSGWSSVVAAGITYVADLKAGPLAGSPVIINMSLGGPTLDAMEKAAIDYAISKGVLIAASAGNSGLRGMGYPGAYAPVISVAATGWTGEWSPAYIDPISKSNTWWRAADIPETGAATAYITDFSSRQLSTTSPAQQLDIAAPGSWIVGPYQTNGQLSWYFLGGTSMASPHVAGTLALMAQKKPSLTQAAAESILKSTAMRFGTWAADVLQPNGVVKHLTWGADATGAGLLNAKAAVTATY